MGEGDGRPNNDRSGGPAALHCGQWCSTFSPLPLRQGLVSSKTAGTTGRALIGNEDLNNFLCIKEEEMTDEVGGNRPFTVRSVCSCWVSVSGVREVLQCSCILGYHHGEAGPAIRMGPETLAPFILCLRHPHSAPILRREPVQEFHGRPKLHPSGASAMEGGGVLLGHESGEGLADI